MEKRFAINKEDVSKIRDWLENRGGVAVWLSREPATHGMSLLTAVRKEDGESLRPNPESRWGTIPEMILLKLEDFKVRTNFEVKRFPVNYHPDPHPAILLVDRTGSRKISRELAKARKKHAEAWHQFPKKGEVAIIASDETTPLEDWIVDSPDEIHTFKEEGSK